VNAAGSVGRHVVSRGFDLVYDVVGQGPALVMLPGYLMTGRWWTDAGYVDLLATEFSVVLVDPLGFGRSSRPVDPDAYRSAALADDLVAILDAEHLSTATVWGFSRGGGLAADFAELHAARTAGLVVGGTAIGVSGPCLIPLHQARRDALTRGDWDAAWSHLQPAFGPDARARVEAENDPAAAAAASIGPLDRIRNLSAITCPVLLYAASGDYTAELAAQDAATLAAGFELFPGLTHSQLFDASSEVLPVVRPLLHKWMITA
jgi:pimeloyl-ACP methyl ester carboxylesterase